MKFSMQKLLVAPENINIMSATKSLLFSNI